MGEEMREIKFKIWDKKNKKWYIQYPNCNNLFNIYKNGTLGRKSEDDDYIFVQYTGRKDRDNKEIYKGDIVKNHWYDCNGKFIGGLWVVKYGMHSIEGQDYYSNSGEGFYFDAQSGIDDDTYNIANLPSDDDRGGIEIVGNIYEDPKLMKERQ